MRLNCNGCRVLRKGCSDACTIRPCLQWIKSPDAQANATVFLAKFYGRAGLLNLITAAPNDALRPTVFRSLLYEACGRIVNPVYGAVGLLWSGTCWHMCQAAVEAVLNGAPIVQVSADDATAAGGPPINPAAAVAGPNPAPTSTSTPASRRWRGIHSLIGAAAELVKMRRMTRAPTLPQHAPRISADPLPPARANEVALGVQDGINHRFQVMGEMSAAFLGGCVQVVFQITAEDFRSQPRQISVAILIATVVAAAWNRLWATQRQQYTIRSNLFQIPWNRIKRWTVLTLLSGGWVWAVVFIVASPSTRPAFQVRIQVATLVQGGLLLFNAILNSTSTILSRLRRRPQGRQGDHDTSRLEHTTYR